MLGKNKILQRMLTCCLPALLASGTVQAQIPKPTWWIGASGGANFNFYNGTTKKLSNSLTVPTAFQRGFGIRPFGSVQMEYRPAGIWGLMLNVGYDDRSGKFTDVMAARNVPASLKTDITYLSVEPSLRIGPTTSHIFFFAGPRLAFQMKHDFTYSQQNSPTTDSELSQMRKTVFSGQVGMGVEYQVSDSRSRTQLRVAPFISYHPTFGQAPREIESLSVATLRTGIAIKFGRLPKAPEPLFRKPEAEAAAHDIPFAVYGPRTVQIRRQVSETLPLRNAVFFDEGSLAIPKRYVLLTKQQARGFREKQLEKEPSPTLQGRSARQLQVYYNILNILGDRMRAHPGTTITLSGASALGPVSGKALAESVKQYLVTVFGISESRITTEGRTKPRIPSEQPNATKELTLLRAEDRRVDIETTSQALLTQAGGGILNPVQITATQADPLDSHVIFKVGGAANPAKPWTLDVTDANGATKRYGPFTRNQESIPGKTILGNRPEATFKVRMRTETKGGAAVSKEASLQLTSQKQEIQKGFRYSILFDFDDASTVASYDKFLTDIVSPQITDRATVIIHGHTDISGEEDHNRTLAHNRATEVQKTLQTALTKAGRKEVRFEIFSFGEDPEQAPFENQLPEERFYNRTVIIDIIPYK
jgi:outer membrane protein OmpA-like peptidoglycan-associated protein